MAGFNDINGLCINCFKEKKNPGRFCEHCGYDQGTAVAPHQLPPRTILNGKYITGRVLGEGGFGITYIGYDLNLDIRVAIKEYYPTGYVTRETTSSATVTPYTGKGEEYLAGGLNKFLSEARTLARFHNLPGIVEVRDFFRENGTAYIVMEFVAGTTLKQELVRIGGRMPVDRVLKLMRPLIESMASVHAQGVIHRDISPDNIMLTPDGHVKLLDFGAAWATDSSGKSVSVMLKPGYAPEEQYLTHGELGPWTDVYALSATIYKLITGETPPESLERAQGVQLRPIGSFGVAIAPGVEAALMTGLAVSRNYRYHSMTDLAAGLYAAAPAPAYTAPAYTAPAYTAPAYTAPAYSAPQSAGAKPHSADNAPAPNKSKLGLILGIAGGAVALVAAAVILILTLGDREGEGPVSAEATPAGVSSAPVWTAVITTPEPTEAPVFVQIVSVPSPGDFFDSDVSVSTSGADTVIVVSASSGHDVENWLQYCCSRSGYTYSEDGGGAYTLYVDGGAVLSCVFSGKALTVRYTTAEVNCTQYTVGVTLEYLDNNAITAEQWLAAGSGYCSSGVNYRGNTVSNLQCFTRVATQGDYLYYTDYSNDGYMYRINISTSATETVFGNNLWAADLNVAGDWVYFTVKISGHEYRDIYRTRADGSSESAELVREGAHRPQVYGDYIYFNDEASGAFCRAALDGSGEQTLITVPGYFTLVAYDRIYSCDIDKVTGIYSTDLTGGDRRLIAGANCYSLAVHGGYIYYTAAPNTGGYLYRLDLDGTGQTLLSTVATASSTRVATDGDYCFFTGADDKLYAVDIFGETSPAALAEDAAYPAVIENDTFYCVFFINNQNLYYYDTSASTAKVFPN